MWLFDFFFLKSAIGYVEVQISRSISESPFDFETTRADCSVIITKTCLYNFHPLKPHFYIVKLGFTGVYIIFLISVLSRNVKNIRIFIRKFSFFVGKIFNIFEWACFRNVMNSRKITRFGTNGSIRHSGRVVLKPVLLALNRALKTGKQ